MESKNAITALGALAQHARLAIYRMLVRQGDVGMAAGSIGAALNLAPATLSFHLRELSQAGLIRARQRSRFIYYSSDRAAMKNLLIYLAENCLRASAEFQDAESIAPPPPPPAAKPVVRPKTRAA
jgi:ArsR family transcriptional regulator, arsenate/arsenite/antimonite-responsive transcriptional repressor